MMRTSSISATDGNKAGFFFFSVAGSCLKQTASWQREAEVPLLVDVEVERNALIPPTAWWVQWYCNVQPVACVLKINFLGHVDSYKQMQAFMSALQAGSMQGS